MGPLAGTFSIAAVATRFPLCVLAVARPTSKPPPSATAESKTMLHPTRMAPLIVFELAGLRFCVKRLGVPVVAIGLEGNAQTNALLVAVRRMP
jgi:hypothetical protein